MNRNACSFRTGFWASLMWRRLVIKLKAISLIWFSLSLFLPSTHENMSFERKRNWIERWKHVMMAEAEHQGRSKPLCLISTCNNTFAQLIFQSARPWNHSTPCRQIRFWLFFVPCTEMMSKWLRNYQWFVDFSFGCRKKKIFKRFSHLENWLKNYFVLLSFVQLRQHKLKSFLRNI